MNLILQEVLSRDEKYDLIIKYEKWTDEALISGEITQFEAWDMYFALLHECDSMQFIEDRKRIVAKIDTKKYNPFLSSNPGVVFLARLRAQGMGLMGNN